MKVECPVCGLEGHLQVRGNSARIGHYVGYRGSTRIVAWHKVDSQSLEMMVNNGNHGNQSVVNKKTAVVVGKGEIGLQLSYKERKGLLSSVGRGSQADYGASLENWCSS
jgi:UDP-N-acetylglucosamine pyrophosphorylase